jgi:hypothetical protein
MSCSSPTSPVCEDLMDLVLRPLAAFFDLPPGFFEMSSSFGAN